MRIRVRAFATLRDHLGAREVEVTVDEDASVRAALAALEADYPGLDGELLVDDRVPSTVTVLRNGRRVSADEPGSVALSAGDELVLAPPVTGG
jgi:molybdopterin synthase sulfur carrier subunit